MIQCRMENISADQTFHRFSYGFSPTVFLCFQLGVPDWDIVRALTFFNVQLESEGDGLGN